MSHRTQKKSPPAAGLCIDPTSPHTSDEDFTFLLDKRSREEGEPPPPSPTPDPPFESPHGHFLRLRRTAPRDLTWLNRHAIANLPSKVSRKCRVFFRPSEPRKRRRQEHFPLMRPAAGPIKKPKCTANTAELSPPGRATVQVVTSPTTVWIVTSQSQRPNKGHVNHREMRGKKKLFSPRAACGAKVARATARRRRRGARVLVSAGAPISHRTQR